MDHNPKYDVQPTSEAWPPAPEVDSESIKDESEAVKAITFWMDSISTGESLRIVDNTGIRRDFSSERGKVMNWNERGKRNEYTVIMLQKLSKCEVKAKKVLQVELHISRGNGKWLPGNRRFPGKFPNFDQIWPKMTKI